MTYSYIHSLPIDYESFRKVQQQDAARIEQLQAKSQFESRVRELVMRLESDINYYEQPGLPRAKADELKSHMNETYNQLINSLRKGCSADLYLTFVKEQRDDTLKAIIDHFHRQPLPRRLDHHSYQYLHPKTKKEWGIISGATSDKF